VPVERNQQSKHRKPSTAGFLLWSLAQNPIKLIYLGFSSDPEDLDWLAQVCLIRVGAKLSRARFEEPCSTPNRNGWNSPSETNELIGSD